MLFNVHNRDGRNKFLLLLFTAKANITWSKNDAFLIGSTKEAFCGTKLPSFRDVMAVYLYRMKSVKTKHDAAIGIQTRLSGSGIMPKFQLVASIILPNSSMSWCRNGKVLK